MIQSNIYCQVSGMAMEAIARLNREGVRLPTVIEIGTADGQGTSRYAGFCGKVIGVDMMASGRPDIVSYYKEPSEVDESKLESFKNRTRELPVDLVIGSSAWEETVQQVKEKLGGKKADVLVVDGCHHPFEAVWKDFTLYQPLVSENGYIIFDDLYEECIEQAYRKAIDEFDYEEVDRFKIHTDSCLQDTGLLRKKR